MPARNPARTAHPLAPSTRGLADSPFPLINAADTMTGLVPMVELCEKPGKTAFVHEERQPGLLF
jgi:hypothetical protein